MQIHITWCTEDVLHEAEELNVELTEDEANDVLIRMEEKHDASIGISWDVMDVYIRDLVDNRRVDSNG
jgi:hypothetical protein